MLIKIEGVLGLKNNLDEFGNSKKGVGLSKINIRNTKFRQS